MCRKPIFRTLLAALLVVVSGGIAAGPSASSATAQGANLLKNPGFDWPAQTNGDVCAPGWQKDNAITPQDWTPYWTCKNDNEKNQDQINRAPEYRVMTVDIASDRVRNGTTSASFFTFWALNRSMGLYQRVQGITPGTKLRFSIWANLLTTDSDELPLNSSRAPGGLQARACIHTTGNFALVPNFNDPAVVCGPWGRYYDTWGEVSVEATAAANEVAVLVDTTADYPVKHNDVHVDDASLTVVGAGGAPATAPVAAPVAQPQTQSQPAPANESAPRVTVKTPTANVRSAPSYTAQIIAQAQQGVSFVIRAYTSDKEWFQVEYTGGQNGTAYIHTSVVTPNAAAQVALGQSSTAPAVAAAAAPAAQTQPQVATSAATVVVSTGGSRLNLRATPASSGTIVAKAADGTSLTVTGISADKQWWQVSVNGVPNNTAWVMAQWVKPNAAAQQLLTR
jgi:uncharacterized protein YgiM (DUF1202 family)